MTSHQEDPMDATSHRPYPVPNRPWLVAQEWSRMLLMHWSVPADTLRDRIHDSLEIDLYDGRAWVGIVPAEVRNSRSRYTPAVSWLIPSAEVNFCTYVRAGNRHGLWYFSLDTSRAVLALGARALFHLPYFRARARCPELGGLTHFESRRATNGGEAAADFRIEYRPVGKAALPEPGSFEHWLVDRYCVFSADQRGWLYRTELHHDRWPLQDVLTSILACSIPSAARIPPPDEQPHFMYAERVDARIWAPLLVEARGKNRPAPKAKPARIEVVSGGA